MESLLQLVAEAAGNQTEIAVARALVAHIRGSWLYDRRTVRWSSLDESSGVWRPDGLGRIEHLVKEYVRCLPGAKPQMQTRRFVRAVLDLMCSDPAIAFDGSGWDTHAHLLGTPGGVYDLRTGERAPDASELFVSRQTSVAPAEKGVRPARWLSYWTEAMGGDQERIDFMQSWAGYCATGETKAHKYLSAVGVGGAGSSVAQETVMHVLGDYATSAPVEAFATVRGERHPAEIAALVGARCIAVAEFPADRPVDESRMKAWVAADRHSTRLMRGDPFNFTPVGKLWITSNGELAYRRVDPGLMRRAIRVHFSHRPAVPDLDLPQKLRAESPAILRWVIEGAVRWYAEGLNPPATMVEGLRSYFEEEDTFAGFLAEWCMTAPDFRVPSAELFAAWRRFCASRNEPAGTAKSFGHMVRAKGFEPTQNAGRHNCRGYLGLALRPGVDTHDAYL